MVMTSRNLTYTTAANDTAVEIAAGIAALTAASDYAGSYSITHDGSGELSVSREDGVNFSIGEGVVTNHSRTGVPLSLILCQHL